MAEIKFPIQVNLPNDWIEQVIDRLRNDPEAEWVEVIRCKDCKNWVGGYITDQDDFIPPKCGKYQQYVGHSADDFCNFAERQEEDS